MNEEKKNWNEQIKNEKRKKLWPRYQDWSSDSAHEEKYENNKDILGYRIFS